MASYYNFTKTAVGSICSLKLFSILIFKFSYGRSQCGVHANALRKNGIVVMYKLRSRKVHTRVHLVLGFYLVMRSVLV